MMQWKDILAKNISSAEVLTDCIPGLKDRESELAAIIDEFPASIPEYYLSLIDQTVEDDPIKKMCIPSFTESDICGTFDTSGEKTNTKLKGLQHKYPQTVLLLSTNRCAMYCRYCFRKRMVGGRAEEIVENMEDVVQYIREHTEISNVLVSGGDSFLLNTDEIRAWLSALCRIPHLDYIRFGTKTPVVFPQRILLDEELQKVLCRYSQEKQIYVVTQYNHPRELTEVSLKSIKCLQRLGVIVKNQTVLLKGVNDSPEVLGSLLKMFTKYGIIPYYIFQCRPVKGVQTQFQVSLKSGYTIVEKAKQMQNGHGKCVKYVLSNPQGKIEVLGSVDEDHMLFKFHQAKDSRDLGRIFTSAVSDDTCWIE